MHPDQCGTVPDVAATAGDNEAPRLTAPFSCDSFEADESDRLVFRSTPGPRDAGDRHGDISLESLQCPTRHLPGNLW